MRLAALILLVEAPLAVAVFMAVHLDATGAESGLLWLCGLLAFILALCVAAAYYEPTA